MANGDLRTKFYDDGELELNVTDVDCARCGQALAMTEEVWRVRIVQAQVLLGDVVYHDVLNEEGRPKHEVKYFEYMCWEQEEDEVRELFEEAPNTEQHPLGVLRCDICESDILEWECFGLAEFGEIHYASRSPLGSPVRFAHMGHEHHICICCLHTMDAGTHNYWDGDVQPYPDRWVCQEGLFDRCWRHGECHCYRVMREEEESNAKEEWTGQ